MDDAIFLLSEYEYLKYKKFIPQLNFDWWLRSPSTVHFPNRHVVFICCDGYLSSSPTNNPWISVRPALRIDKVKIDKSKNRFVYCGITWVKIDKNIAISELPIGRQSFNENPNNDYEKSDIRNWLLNWIEERKNY